MRNAGKGRTLPVGWLLLPLLALLLSASPTSAAGAVGDDGGDERAAAPRGAAAGSEEPDASAMAVRLAQEMAESASRRDVQALAKLIPQTDKVVYVSNGRPITGKQYVETLGGYYASLKVLEFKWDRWEVTPIDRNAAVFTGWAIVRTVDLKGVEDNGRALFTMVFARDGSGWKRVIAQKWQAEAPALTASSPAADAGDVSPETPITLHFSSPVNAGASAFRVECPSGRPLAASAAPAAADPSVWVLRPQTRLPSGSACTVTVLAAQVTEDHFNQPMPRDVRFSFSTAPAR